LTLASISRNRSSVLHWFSGSTIANDRRLRQLIQQMRQIAAKAAELKLKQAANP
jgi:hypothetical protein